MNKQKVFALSALALIAVVGGAGLGTLKTAAVHAQSPPAQVQQVDPKDVPDANEKPDVAETSEKNIPGGGHQDTNETVDHQYDGVE